MKLKKIVIFGSGGHAFVALSEIIKAKKFKIIGVVDDYFDKKKINLFKYYGVKYLGNLNKFSKSKSKKNIFGFVAVGDNKKRQEIVIKLAKIIKNIRWATIISKDAIISTNVKIGEEFWIWLQLKTIADIGIIGLPNAGKSSLLASITKATPKIANYKFTTLNPNLGVAIYDNKEIILADIPGIIEGAHSGTGLGIKFLKHIERCKTLLHLIDVTENDLFKSYKQIREELGKYSKDLLKKNELVVLNKIDLINKKELKEKEEKFNKKTKKKVLLLSTIKKQYISKIKSKIINYAS